MARRALAAVPDQPLRVVLYLRVSALMGRGGDDFHSPDLQLGAIRRVTPGMREVAVVEDIDQSGRTFTRDGIDTIRGMAQRREFDVLAVLDVSRLGRNVRESLVFLNWLADQGVTIRSASEAVDTSTPAGRLMLTNMLAIAEYRSDEIGAGWSRLIAHRARDGHHHGKPLGYTRAAKRMVPDPVLGPAVTDVFRRYANEDPLADICRAFAAVRGKPIIAGNLKKLMRNPVYLGKVRTGSELFDGAHESLVDPDTWQRVQDRLTREAATKPRHLNPGWPLVGLAECPAGHHLQRQPHRRRDGQWEHRLLCGSNRSDLHGADPCPGVGRPVLAAVEAETLRQVAVYGRRLRDDHEARAVRMARITRATADRAGLQREQERLRAGMQKLMREWALGGPDDDIYRTTLAELRERHADIAAELARLDGASRQPDPVTAASAIDAMLAMWPRMTVAEKGEALRALVRRVVVRPAAYWREPEADRVDVQFCW